MIIDLIHVLYPIQYDCDFYILLYSDPEPELKLQYTGPSSGSTILAMVQSVTIVSVVWVSKGSNLQYRNTGNCSPNKWKQKLSLIAQIKDPSGNTHFVAWALHAHGGASFAPLLGPVSKLH
jgi:hypothetical protein